MCESIGSPIAREPSSENTHFFRGRLIYDFSCSFVAGRVGAHKVRSACYRSLSEKSILCVISVVLGVSVVKFAKEFIHHRVTEDAQRTTEFIFPTDSYRSRF